MMARVELSNRKYGRERVSMNLFLPVRENGTKRIEFSSFCSL